MSYLHATGQQVVAYSGHGAALVTAIYRTTAKNKPRFEFLERSGFHCGNDGATEWLNSWMIIERKRGERGSIRRA